MRRGLRQGDVLLVPVDGVRGEAVQPVAQRYTVAEGEQTGHHHSIPASETAGMFLSRDGMFVNGAGDVLTHQEHDPHQVSGAYEVIQQRRFTDHPVRSTD